MRKKDGNGHLIVEKTIISQAAVNEYWGDEIPNADQLGLEPNKKYRLLRDPQELTKAIDTFKGIQLLIKHIPVSADEPSTEFNVGSIGTDVEMEGNNLVASLRVWTQEGIDLIESKKLQELSSGYAYRADMTPGEWQGQQYDGVMRDIHGNHVALVEHGRIGRDAIIADHLPLDRLEKHMKLKQGSAPIILAALQKIAQDGTADEKDVEAITKTVADSLDDDKAEDEESEKKAEDEDDKKSDAEDEEEDDDKKKASDEENDDNPKKPAMDMALMQKKIAQDVEAQTVKRMNELFEARELVEPIVGKIALDSAEAVYKYALDQKGVSTKGVHPSAYKPMVGMLSQQKVQQVSIAQDSAFEEVNEATTALIGRFG